MKLLPMTEFVLQNKCNTEFHMNDTVIETGKLMQLFFRYAEFLHQKSNLGMFIPVDKSGNVLGKPDWEKFEGYTDDFYKLDKEYHEAKEKVLFEGFYYQVNTGKDGKKYEYVRNKFPHVFSFDQIKNNTVESLLTGFKKKFLIDLTPYAIKQFSS